MLLFTQVLVCRDTYFTGFKYFIITFQLVFCIYSISLKILLPLPLPLPRPRPLPLPRPRPLKPPRNGAPSLFTLDTSSWSSRHSRSYFWLCQSVGATTKHSMITCIQASKKKKKKNSLKTSNTDTRQLMWPFDSLGGKGRTPSYLNRCRKMI